MACGTGKWAFSIGIVVACVGNAQAGEWSVTPLFSWLADHSSNRGLIEGDPESQSYGANVDLSLARRDEDSEILVQPHYRMQRFVRDLYPDVDDMQLAARGHWLFETSSLDVNAQAAQESTLTTELAETGLVRADSNRRTYAGGIAWQFGHSETRQFGVSLGYQDVDYTGAREELLTGFRYATANVGETFNLSPRATLTASVFGSQLRNPDRDSTSDDRGVSLGVRYAWTERTLMSLTLGMSTQDTDGTRQTGTTRDFSLEHKGERLDWNLAYSHSLQPYGTGVLAARDTAQLELVRALSPRVSALLRGSYARNEDGGFGLTLDSRDYRFGEADLRWQLRETWTASLSSGYSSARQDAAFFNRAENASGWAVSVHTTWAPRALVIGH
jgi:outer membrane usher protein FimD/PapC